MIMVWLCVAASQPAILFFWPGLHQSLLVKRKETARRAFSRADLKCSAKAEMLVSVFHHKINALQFPTHPNHRCQDPASAVLPYKLIAWMKPRQAAGKCCNMTVVQWGLTRQDTCNQMKPVVAHSQLVPNILLLLLSGFCSVQDNSRDIQNKPQIST